MGCGIVDIVFTLPSLFDLVADGLLELRLSAAEFETSKAPPTFDAPMPGLIPRKLWIFLLVTSVIFAYMHICKYIERLIG